VSGEIEGDRKSFLSGGEIAPVEGVGILGRGEAGILPDGPGLGDVHGRVGAAQIGRDAGIGVEAIEPVEIGRVIDAVDRDAFGREPGGDSAAAAAEAAGIAAAAGSASANSICAKSGMRLIFDYPISIPRIISYALLSVASRIANPRK